MATLKKGSQGRDTPGVIIPTDQAAKLESRGAPGTARVPPGMAGTRLSRGFT